MTIYDFLLFAASLSAVSFAIAGDTVEASVNFVAMILAYSAGDRADACNGRTR